METKVLRPDQLQHLLTTLKADYKQLMASYRSSWSSAEDHEESRRILVGSVNKTRDAVQSLQGTSDPELRQLVSKLIVQSELAGGTLKNPSTLRL
jgi:hypothetical protein